MSSYTEYLWLEELAAFSLFVTPFLFSYYALTPNVSIIKDKGKCLCTIRFWLTVVTFLFIGFYGIFSFYIFIKYVEFGWSIKSNESFAVAIAIFTILSYLILVPPQRKDAFHKNAQQYQKRNFSHELTKIPAFYVYALSLIISLLPNVATKISGASFRLLNIGGGVERSYYFTPKARITVPPELIKDCSGENYCITKKMKVIFDIGELLYVKGNYFNQNGTVLSLPGIHLYVVNFGKEPQNTRPSR